MGVITWSQMALLWLHIYRSFCRLFIPTKFGITQPHMRFFWFFNWKTEEVLCLLKIRHPWAQNMYIYSYFTSNAFWKMLSDYTFVHWFFSFLMTWSHQHLRNTSQVFCRMSLNWDLSSIFLVIRQELWVWERRIIEIKYQSLCIISKVHAINMCYHCWC